MSKKRPGVEASIRLSKQLSNTEVWEQVESQLGDVTTLIEKLDTFTKNCVAIATQLADKENNAGCISKEQLLKVVQWKFAVGKPRHALMKFLTSNSGSCVQEHSQAAISLAMDMPEHNSSRSTSGKYPEEQFRQALTHLTNLKGVGPATASAVLTLVRPDHFCHMYDEVIDCFLPKRTYTLPVYQTVNEKCTDIANNLGEGWTTSRVARTLWVAARVCKSGELTDFTLPSKASSTSASSRKRVNTAMKKDTLTGSKRRKSK